VLEQSKMKIDFGSQIRSYVLQPYTKVKDHAPRWRSATRSGSSTADRSVHPVVPARGGRAV